MKAIFMSSNQAALKNVYKSEVRERLSGRLEFPDDIYTFDEKTLAERADELAQTDFIFSTWGMPRFSREFIREKLPKLKAVFYGAGSVQGFAREFLDEGRTVVSAWAANALPVAEFTVAQIILAGKGYFQRLKKCSSDGWANRRAKCDYLGNYGAKIGIIGAGMVGRAVIKLLKNYRFDIYVFDPFLPDKAAAELGVKKTSLEFIFAECPIISNHLANNPATVGMLNGRLFSLMQPNAAFINTGRGAQVVEADLCAAMRDYPERIALLDVTFPEPPEAGSELYALDNVYLSPHIAGSLGDEVARMGEYMLSEFEAFVDGRPLNYSVTPKMLETMA